METRVALVGNPNCGKTTMFNDLTGSKQYVGNWPGVTVEKKEGKLRGERDIVITDLPGIYSLSPYTLEEVVSRDYLLKERPDVILNLIDGTNIERNLYLTTQLLEMGLPVVIAMNMIDIVEKRGDTIDLAQLENTLGCEVIATSALKGVGSREAAERAADIVSSHKARAPRPIKFSQVVEVALEKIGVHLKSKVAPEQLRWYEIKVFERDERVMEDLDLDPKALEQIEFVITMTEKVEDDDSASIIVNERYKFIEGLVKQTVHKKSVKATMSEKIDRVVTNRWAALPIFAIVMFAVYFISVSWIGTAVTNWTNDVLFGTWILPAIGTALQTVGAASWLNSLLVDGIASGVGAVLGFVPQMAILFLFLSLLEDCGYMSRIAFILDKVFRRFGLSGKSFIPMLISSGCGVPGIMATKTIENENDRRMTIMTTTFIPCGAKLPVIALIGGAMFPQFIWMAPAMYFLGIVAVIVSGIILKKTRWFQGEATPFVMELPEYHLPSMKTILMHVWERVRAFIVKAGTVIFLASAVTWFLSSFGFVDGQFGMVEVQNSILAAVGGFIAPIFRPLGFGTWQAAVGSLSGLVAKENIVATFGVLFGVGGDASVAGLYPHLRELFPFGVAAFSFLVFNLLCAPCIAAMSAMAKELGSARWTAAAIGYQCGLAYIVSFLIYQFGGLIFGNITFSAWTVVAIVVAVIGLWLLFRPVPKRFKKASGGDTSGSSAQRSVPDAA